MEVWIKLLREVVRINLYVIGNGFDLHHYLQTSYGNYSEYLRENYPTIKKEYENFPYLSFTDSPWSDIEAALSIDYVELLDDAIGVSYPDVLRNDSDSRWSDLDVDIEEMTRFFYAFTGDCFFEWLSKLEYSKAYADLLLPKDAEYINFNYTNTLQRLYGIRDKNILHIHGMLCNVVANGIEQDVFPSNNIETIEALGPTVEKDKWNSDIIREEIQFGASDITAKNIRKDLENRYKDAESYFVSVEPAICTIERFAEKTTKNIFDYFNTLQTFISNINFEEVVIMETSLGINDDPYYTQILIPALGNIKWTFMLFKDKDGVNEMKINSFVMRTGLKNYELVEW